MALSCLAKVTGSEAAATITGAIDENSLGSLEKLAGELQGAKTIALDLGRLDSLNSFGTAHWVKFLKLLPADARYEFREATAAFVSYCKLIAEVMGRGTLVSCRVGYDCEACDHRDVLTIALAGFDKGVGFPRRHCPKCNAPSERFRPLEDADEYLSFLP